jgi:septal ring factor EnvC (AmiA/AmiB activator)
MSASAGPRGVPSEAEVKEISDLLGKEIETRRKELGLPSARRPGHISTIAADLGTLEVDYDIYNTRFSSRRRVFGPLIIRAKKLLREFLNPILVRQVAYNGANSRVATYLAAQVDVLNQGSADLRCLIDDNAERAKKIEQEAIESQRELREQLDAIREEQTRLAEDRRAVQNLLAQLQLQVDELMSLNHGHTATLETTTNRLAATERDLRRLVYTLRVMRWLRKKEAAC